MYIIIKPGTCLQLDLRLIFIVLLMPPKKRPLSDEEKVARKKKTEEAIAKFDENEKRVRRDLNDLRDDME